MLAKGKNNYFAIYLSFHRIKFSFTASRKLPGCFKRPGWGLHRQDTGGGRWRRAWWPHHQASLQHGERGPLPPQSLPGVHEDHWQGDRGPGPQDPHHDAGLQDPGLHGRRQLLPRPFLSNHCEGVSKSKPTAKGRYHTKLLLGQNLGVIRLYLSNKYLTQIDLIVDAKMAGYSFDILPIFQETVLNKSPELMAKIRELKEQLRTCEQSIEIIEDTYAVLRTLT